MATETQELVRAAMQLEQDGRQFYLDAAGKAESDLVRGTFEGLADDELRHMAYIREISTGQETLKTVNERVYDRLRGIFFDVPDAVREEAAEMVADVAALNFAIGIEEKSRVAYEKWGQETQDTKVRGLCELLTGAELFHRQLLENVVSYLDSPSDFFMREERWFVEG